MLEKTKGIVLHTLKYGESSLIVHVYTLTSGRQSLIVNAPRGQRAHSKLSQLQPLFLLDLDIHYKPGREVNRIKELRGYSPYSTLPFDMVKTTQAIFIAEVLSRLLVEAESNPELYEFLETSLLYFDLMQTGSHQFHLWLLVQLTDYLGIRPEIQAPAAHWFDLEKGLEVDYEPSHPHSLTPANTALLLRVLQTGLMELSTLKIPRSDRNQLLQKILQYYHLHFNNLASLKSMAVLAEVFS